MDYLSNAQNKLDRAQGDVFNEAHKQDLLKEALISALIAIAQELQGIRLNLEAELNLIVKP